MLFGFCETYVRVLVGMFVSTMSCPVIPNFFNTHKVIYYYISQMTLQYVHIVEFNLPFLTCVPSLVGPNDLSFHRPNSYILPHILVFNPKMHNAHNI